MFAFFAAILTSEQIKEKRNRIEKSKQMQENIKDKKVLKMCEASALHKSKADFQENGGYLYD